MALLRESPGISLIRLAIAEPVSRSCTPPMKPVSGSISSHVLARALRLLEAQSERRQLVRPRLHPIVARCSQRPPGTVQEKPGSRTPLRIRELKNQGRPQGRDDARTGTHDRALSAQNANEGYL